jgi:hypothetical protein
MIKYLTVIITCGVLLLTISCKKESKNTASSNPGGGGGSAASLSLTAYPNVTGHKWVYNVNRIETYDLNNTTTTYTYSQTYTVNVIADTTLPDLSKGKIWSLTFSDTNQAPLKSVAFKDTTDNLFKILPIGDSNSDVISFTLLYPLNLNTPAWLNYSLSPQDSSKVINQTSYSGQQALKIQRGSWPYNGFELLINKKGCVNSISSETYVSGGLLVHTNTENKLISTNF